MKNEELLVICTALVCAQIWAASQEQNKVFACAASWLWIAFAIIGSIYFAMKS